MSYLYTGNTSKYWLSTVPELSLTQHCPRAQLDSSLFQSLTQRCSRAQLDSALSQSSAWLSTVPELGSALFQSSAWLSTVPELSLSQRCPRQGSALNQRCPGKLALSKNAQKFRTISPNFQQSFRIVKRGPHGIKLHPEHILKKTLHSSRHANFFYIIKHSFWWVLTVRKYC